MPWKRMKVFLKSAISHLLSLYFAFQGKYLHENKTFFLNHQIYFYYLESFQISPRLLTINFYVVDL